MFLNGRGERVGDGLDSNNDSVFCYKDVISYFNFLFEMHSLRII